MSEYYTVFNLIAWGKDNDITIEIYDKQYLDSGDGYVKPYIVFYNEKNKRIHRLSDRTVIGLINLCFLMLPNIYSTLNWVPPRNINL